MPAPAKPGAKPASTKATPFGKPSSDDVLEYVIPEGSDGLVPDGKYEVKCTGVTSQESEAGNPMFVWNMVITKGQYAGMDFPIFTALTQAAMWKLTETLEALGFDSTVGKKNKLNKSDARGRMAIATMKQEVQKKGKGKGKKRSVIQSLEEHPKGAGYKPAGSTGNPFTDRQASEVEEDEQEENVGVDETESYEEPEVTDEDNEEAAPEAETEEEYTAGEDDPDAEPEEEPEPEPDPDDDDDEIPVAPPSKASQKVMKTVATAARRPAAPPAPPARKSPPAPPRRPR